MKFKILLLIFFIFIDKLLPQPIAQREYKYKTITSKHFKIHFPEQFIDFAINFLQLAENVHQKLSKDYFIEDIKTNLVLIFNHDISNAYTTVHGLDTIVFYLTQPSPGSFTNYKNWYEQLILHEYTHIITLRPYSGFWNYFFRLLFGIPPNLALPDGILEGISVLEESNIKEKPVIGRLFDEDTNALIRNQLLYGKFPSSEEILGGTYYWPLGDTVYLYGARYINTILQNTEKKQFTKLFYSQRPSFLLRYRFSELDLKTIDNYHQLLKQNEYELYKNWYKKRFDVSITPYEQLTFHGGFKKYLNLFNGQIYYFESSSFRSSGIYKLNFSRDSQTELFYRARDIHQYDLSKNIVTSEPIFYNGFEIIQYNLYINKTEVIDTEIHSPTRKINPIYYNDSLIYIELEDPFISIVKVPYKKIYSIVYLDHNSKELIFKTYMDAVIDFLILYNENLYFVLKPSNSSEHQVLKCSISNNECLILFSSNYIITTLSIDNSGILFSSNLKNHYDIYKFDFELKKIYRLTNNFVNSKFPLFFNDHLYFIGDTYRGSDIFRIHKNDLLLEEIEEGIDIKGTDYVFSYKSISDESIYNFKDYSLFEFRFYLDGILTNENTDLAFQISGYDPLRRHYLNFGMGVFDIYTLYFFSYTYNRFLPFLTLSYAKTNPFHNDKDCYVLLNSMLRNTLCKLNYGFEQYNIRFSYPYSYRLLRTNTILGFNHKKNRNALSSSSTIYPYNNFSQNSIIFIFNINYYENYYLSISPENGFNFQFRIEHFPSLWNRIENQNSIEKQKIQFTYTTISSLLEFFIPWFINNHVPYVSFFTTWNQDKDYNFIKNSLANFQYGLLVNDSYGSGNFVLTTEYRFPLLYSSKRILEFLPEVGIHWISIAPFYQMGKSFEKTIYEDKTIFYTKGLRLTAKLYAFFLPFYFNIIYAKGTEEQVSFGFSLNTNFHMQFLQHQQHPEYLLPTWNYK